MAINIVIVLVPLNPLIVNIVITFHLYRIHKPLFKAYQQRFFLFDALAKMEIIRTETCTNYEEKKMNEKFKFSTN